MHALVMTNMYPSSVHPALGSFVRDQVRALKRHPDVDVEVFAFDPGGASAYVRAGVDVRRHYRGQRFDVVHAHFGLTAWPAIAAPARRRVVTLHGTDIAHPRSRAITLAALRYYDLVAAVSEPLAASVPRDGVAVLPCGVDVERFKPIPRPEARAELGLDPDSPYLLFPADPTRPEKRHDRAVAVADGAALLALRNVDPAEVPLWVNAANAVLVPSERESFGLATLEALACDVPVLATPVGIAPEALRGVEGTLCAPFDTGLWRAAVATHISAADPRVIGRASAEEYSAEKMAARVVEAWRAIV
jgi:teichuronic acid biosynthesis glycosyltransferase TuaC